MCSADQSGNFFSPSLFSYQDGLSWHLHICGQSVPSAVTVLPCSSDPLVTSCSQNELRTALHWYLVNYLMLGHTSNGRAQPPIGRARAPVCPSLATLLKRYPNFCQVECCKSNRLIMKLSQHKDSHKTYVDVYLGKVPVIEVNLAWSPGLCLIPADLFTTQIATYSACTYFNNSTLRIKPSGYSLYSHFTL